MVAVCSVFINLKLNARPFGCVHARLLTQYVQCIEHLVCNPLKDMTNIFASHANCTVAHLIWLHRRAFISKNHAYGNSCNF